MIDRRRRRWFSLSALYPHGETARRIQAEFGRDGLLVWILFLAACKRSPAQGSFAYTSEEAAWAELGLLDPTDRPAFSLAEFWRFTGRLKQTRQTRSGHVTNVSATHWKEWQDASARRIEAERKSRKRGEKRPDIAAPDSDSDLDHDRDHGPAADQDQDLRARTRDHGEEQDPKEGGEPAAAAGRPIGEAELRTVIESLEGSDVQSLNVVAPLADCVSRETLLAAVERVRARDARNPVGLLVRFLQLAIRDARTRSALAALPERTEPVERVPLREALELSVRQLAANGHPWDAVADVIRDAFGEEHLDEALLLYGREAREAAA